MSLYEIDDLLLASVALVRAAEADGARRKNAIWNLEQIPERYGFDAGGFDKTETGEMSGYETMDAPEVAIRVARLADATGDRALVYDWTAFMLIWGPGYFDAFQDLDSLKQGALGELKEIFGKHDYEGHQPRHRSLTMDLEEMEEMAEETGDERLVALMRWMLEA